MENTGEAIWKSFSEKGIVLAGIDGPEYQAFFQSLVRVSQTSRAGFRVLDGVENVQDGDYVLLFARPTIAEHLPSAQKKRSGAAARRRREAGKKENKDWSTPFEEAEHPAGWEKPSGLWKQAGEDWEETLQLLSQLQSLAKTRPAAVLLISGNEVYGKCFGTPHALREEELGYISHTAGSDIRAQCMRTAGAFCLCTGARWAAGSNRENGTAFGGIAAGTSGNLVRRFFYMVQMRKFITCRVNNRICLRKLFRSYPIRQMSRERSRCLCLNSRVQRKLQRPRYVRQQTGRLSLSRKRQRRCIDSPCSLQR